MNNLEQKVLLAIRAKPLSSQQELADSLGMSRESVAGYIMRLTRKGDIIGKGYIFPSKNNIVVIGGANVDLCGTVFNTFRSGDSNPGAVSQSVGGVGRNIAENLSRLGNEVHLITLIGKDNHGQFLVEQAAQLGMHVQDFIQHPKMKTSTYLVINSHQGEMLGAVADMAIIDHLSPELLAGKLPRIQSATQLVIDANLSPDTIRWLASKNLSVPIAADGVSVPKVEHLRPLLNQINLLKVNKLEAFALLDIEANSSLESKYLIDGLLALGIKRVLLSLGAQGAVYGSKTETIHQTPPASSLINDTGAGDALLAGFIHAEKIFKNTSEQLSFAMACAAFTLEAPNAVHPQLAESSIANRFSEFLTLPDLTLFSSDSKA